MVTVGQKTLESKKGTKETVLTPRFYTTDFQEISQLDIRSNIEEIQCIIEEFRLDYNRKLDLSTLQICQ